MAITLRYGDTGDLGALAVQAGQGQEFARRFADEQRLVQGVRQQQAQQEAQRLEAQRLQLAAQSRARNAARTPTGNQARLVRSPVVQNIQQEKQMFAPRPTSTDAGTGYIEGGGTRFELQPGGDITGTRQYTDASGRVRTEPIPQDAVEQRGGFVQSTPPATAAPLADRKARYIQALGLPPEVQEALQPMVQDDEIDLNQLAIRAEPFRRQTTQDEITTGRRLSYQRSLMREQADDLDRQMRALGDHIKDVFAINPQTDISVERLAGYRQTQPKLYEALLQWRRLRAQKMNLRQQEAALIQNPQGATPAQTPPPATQSSGWSIQRVE